MLKLLQRFSIYSNQHHSPREVINGKEFIYDNQVHLYSPTIQAFLQKRWTKKEEISAKIYIIDPIKTDHDYGIYLQPLKKLLEENRLIRMFETNDISSQYVMSIFFEEHFKPLLDTYSTKVIMNGYVPPLVQSYNYQKIEQQAKTLYRTFFLGDELTDLEKEIEFKYLALKQKKFMKYNETSRNQFKCVWTFSQQRRIEGYMNWRSRQQELFDDLRPIFEPVYVGRKLQAYQLLQELDQTPWSEKLSFNIFEKPRFQDTKKKVEWLSTILFSRTIIYTKSLEFVRTLEIPPDFHIELSLVNFHIWLITNRLRQINTKDSNFMARMMSYNYLVFLQNQISKVHIRKKNDFIKDAEQYMETSRRYLEYHFNKNPTTIANNYHKIDSLVWSVVFFEKVPRYDNKVYLMAEYLKANYDYISQLQYSQFDQCDLFFDVFRIGMDYKKKILTVNPPLNEVEFTQEFESESPTKKYFYTYDDKISQKFQHIKDIQNNKSLVHKRLQVLNENISYVFRKYENLETYDHYSSQEDQIKKQEEKQKYVWNFEQNDMDVNKIKEKLKRHA